MKTLNRTLLALILAIEVLLVWSLLSRTAWASSVSLLGIGDNFEYAYQPIVKVLAMTVVAVSGVQLIRQAFGFVRSRLARPRPASTSAHNPA